MMLLLLVLLAVSLTNADEMAENEACRTITRDDLLACFAAHVDANHDNSLSAGEISAFLNAQNIPVLHALMTICDINNDNVLNMVDWNSTSACAQEQAIITRTCFFCVRAGWTPSSMRK